MKSLFNKYFFSLERRRLENALVDEILKLSSIPKSNDLKIILEKLSKSRNKIISYNFIDVLQKINKGHKPKEVFDILKRKYNSDILNRFLDLIHLSTTSGTITFTDYKNVADNFIKTKQVLDERHSNLLMQRYTIIFSSGLIVPGILGIVVSLIRSLRTSIPDAISTTGLSLYSITFYCVIIYIIEFVLISSIYLSILEDNRRKAIIYLVILLPVSLLIFFLSMLI